MNRMSIPEFIIELKKGYSGPLEYQQRSEKRVYIRVPRENIQDIAFVIFRKMGAKFSIASGVDVQKGFEVLYHFTFDRDNFICTVRTLAPRDDPKLDSIASIVPGALWIEREIYEILGVVFTGHPKLKRLVKAEFIGEHEFPFRKDFDQKKFKEKHKLPIPK